MDNTEAERVLRDSAKRAAEIAAAKDRRVAPIATSVQQVMDGSVSSDWRPLPKDPLARCRIRKLAADCQAEIDGDRYRDLALEEQRKRLAQRERLWEERDRQRAADEARQLEASRQRFLRAAEIPLRCTGANLDDLSGVPVERRAAYGKVVSDIRKLVTYPGTYVAIGGRGTGKTQMACGLINDFCRAGRRALYTKAIRIFREIKSSWGRQKDAESEADFLERLLGYDLLVIDEMQVRSETDWENIILTDLIDDRYAALKATLLVANLTESALAESLGTSITSRLEQVGIIVLCDWPSLRRPEVTAPQVKYDQAGKVIFPPPAMRIAEVA